MIKARGFAVALCVSWLTSIVQADQVDLKFQPANGSVLKLKTTLDQKVTQNVNNNSATVSQTLALTYRFTTQEVANSSSTLKVVYEAVAFKQQSPLGNAQYDSENPPAVIPPVAKGFAALVGQNLQIKVGPAGRVSDVKGVDEMVDEIIRRLDLPDGPVKPLLEKSLRHDFSAEAIQESMESIFLIYPDRQVTVGDTWTHTLAITKGYPVVVDTTFTLKVLTADQVVLDLSSKLYSRPDAAPLDVGSPKLKYSLSGTQAGTITLNRIDGAIRSGDVTQKVSGTMTMDAPDGKTETPLAIESHITMEGK